MSWRRPPEATAPTMAHQQQGRAPGLAIITETGFGICEDGSIGFSDCVLRQQQQLRAPVGPNPFTAMPAPAPTPAADKAEGLRSYARDDDDEALASSMFASLRVGGGARTTARRCGGPRMCSCPDGGLRAPMARRGGPRMCACPDGGVPATNGFMKMLGFGKHGDDESSSSDEDEKKGRGTWGAARKTARGAYEKVKRRANNALDGAKRAMSFKERMNAMVFEAVAGVPYSKEAARQHAVVDIFQTFPGGVPTHAGMNHGEVKEAARLTAMLEVARDGVREAATTGKPLPRHIVDVLYEIHSSTNNDDIRRRVGRILKKNEDDVYKRTQKKKEKKKHENHNGKKHDKKKQHPRV